MTPTCNPRFSIFPRGYRNKAGQAVLATKPQQNQDIPWLYQYVTSQWCAGTATQTLRNHLCFHHGIDPDKSGSDVSRACFLPYDPDCFINPKYL